MTKNLETAELVVKLILAVSVVVFYFAGVIEGPLARVLMILGLLVLVLFATKLALTFIIRD